MKKVKFSQTQNNPNLRNKKKIKKCYHFSFLFCETSKINEAQIYKIWRGIQMARFTTAYESPNSSGWATTSAFSCVCVCGVSVKDNKSSCSEGEACVVRHTSDVRMAHFTSKQRRWSFTLQKDLSDICFVNLRGDTTH